MQMHFAWEKWVSNGWTEKDLVLVVDHINRLIKLNRRRPESLRFRNLIEDTERFNEDIAEARSLATVRAKIKQQQGNVARNKALLATGRSMPEVHKVRTPAQILAGEQALRDLLKARDNL